MSEKNEFYKLDNINRKIINILLKNARTPYSDIAKTVGLKSPSVIERIKHLEKEKIIKGYSIDIDYQRIGYDIIALIGLIINDSALEEAFKNKILDFDDDIVECYEVSGNFTLIIKVITKNTQTLSKLLSKLKKEPGFQETHTIIVFKVVCDKKHPV
ncbi:MAG: Lrp/AsnC family transcriptional regulator [Deferribacterota bacterium]|nr:Lrp/AsnC family transcriptional regulator [Deferribacterota bacterium]